MQVYVKAKSKKEINEKLLNGLPVTATSYDIRGDTCCDLRECPDSTCVKIYEKYVGGSPYAKAYGTWRPGKTKVV